MLLLTIVPLVVIGLTGSVLAIRSAGNARDSVASSRADLLQDTVGASRADTAADFVEDTSVLINDRLDLMISWRAVPEIVAGADQDWPGTGELVVLSTDEVESRFAGGAVLDSSGRLSRLLQGYTASRPEFAELFFTDANGFNVASSGPTSDFVQSDEGWWQRAWLDGASVGTLDFDESAGVQSFDLAVRIDHPSTGRPLGVLKGVVDARDLYRVADGLAAEDGEGQQVRVIEPGGRLLMETATGHDPTRVGRTVLFDGDQARALDIALASGDDAGFAVLDDTVVGFARTSDTFVVEQLQLTIPNNRWITLVEEPIASAVEPLSPLDALSRDLQRAGQLSVILLAVVVALAAIGAVSVAQSMASRLTRPLDDLRAEAGRIANDELPSLVEQLRSPFGLQHIPEVAPIDVEADGEMAELVDAFERMRLTALDLAGTEALARRSDASSLLVNLGRRNQLLVGRQLEFIDRLEQTESDPHTLQHLFELDQMATRMRRNAESLLILAGEHPGRGPGEAMPVGDVLRAATSEIEHYHRVSIDSVDPVLIDAKVCTDVIHLLAELLENGTRYSPPTSQVQVIGSREIDDRYTISIVDAGIGLGREELGDINRLLANPGAPAAADTGRLGLHVVARLAAVHGVDARLVESSTVGVTAKVTLPESCLVEVDDRQYEQMARRIEEHISALDDGPQGDLHAAVVEVGDGVALDRADTGRFDPGERVSAGLGAAGQLARETGEFQTSLPAPPLAPNRSDPTQGSALDVNPRQRPPSGARPATAPKQAATPHSLESSGARVQREPGEARAIHVQQHVASFAAGVAAAQTRTSPPAHEVEEEELIVRPRVRPPHGRSGSPAPE